MVPVRNASSRHFNRFKTYICDDDDENNEYDNESSFLMKFNKDLSNRDCSSAIRLEFNSHKNRYVRNVVSKHTLHASQSQNVNEVQRNKMMKNENFYAGGNTLAITEERDSASTLLMLDHTKNDFNNRHVIREAKNDNSLEEEEEELQDMDRRGELNQVVGSQSLLSQEINHQSLSQLSTTAESSLIDGCYQEDMLSSQQPVVLPPNQGQLVIADDKYYGENSPCQTKKPYSEDWKQKDSITTTPTFNRTKFNSANNHRHLPVDSPDSHTSDILLSSSYAREVSDCDENFLTEPNDKQKNVHNSDLNSDANMKDVVNRLEANRIKKEGTMEKKKRNYDNSGRLNKKLEKQKKQEEELEYAKKAALLAKQALGCPKISKQLLLAMALNRENPRTTPDAYPPKGTDIHKGFAWGKYPPLESLLRKEETMKEYYSLSVEKCQTKAQQDFNNKLVVLIRREAQRFGWNIKLEDRQLRDRIRCFFKTHVQNAKKRMNTMLKNPSKKANAKALVALMDLIEQTQDFSRRNEGTITTSYLPNSTIVTPMPTSTESNSIIDNGEKDCVSREVGNDYAEGVYQRNRVQNNPFTRVNPECVEESSNSTAFSSPEPFQHEKLNNHSSPLKKRKRLLNNINRYKIKRTKTRNTFARKKNIMSRVSKGVGKDAKKESCDQNNVKNQSDYDVISNLQDDSEAHDAAKQVLALGFSRLSQDDEIVKSS